MSGAQAVEWLSRHEDEGVARWMDWLRIKSISTDPAYADDCAKAAEWGRWHQDRLTDRATKVRLRTLVSVPPQDHQDRKTDLGGT